ncbi:formate C-acetyltransferase [Oxalobacter sp. OttesenSCG-928-P03]|nr:formate C-acetyltransferase [Oxalobacter sp. OttesenSCG-928-P03]
MRNPQKAETTATTLDAWRGFKGDNWRDRVAVRDFIAQNRTEYLGNEDFLAGPTERTKKVWAAVQELQKAERENGGVLAVASDIGSSIMAFSPGYIDQENEICVGLQTDAPLKRAIHPNGGLRMIEMGLEEYGFPPVDEKIHDIYTHYRKTHNQGVFDVYDPEIIACRRSGVITGLPDAYGRGRIIGDYRRVALYGTDFLIADKRREKAESDGKPFSEDIIRIREELSEQIHALQEMKEYAKSYGFDISGPATTAVEAAQWTYFGFICAAKEANGAATGIGRITTFLDIYIQRDLEEGRITEAEAQEIIDQLVIKCRILRYLRTLDFDALFSGDPTWVTIAFAGMCDDGRSMVTKTDFRLLHTLDNLGTSPEPNLTILWTDRLPEGFKKYAARMSIQTSAVQFENDDLLRNAWGDDCCIGCCVSPQASGKQMQYFGARANLAKALLYAINGGVDELSGEKVAEGFEPITSEYLDYDEVITKFDKLETWLCETYVRAMNAIHYMHDKYAYERLMMAFHDRDVLRTMAFGLAGVSLVADSLSAIKYAKVKPIRNEKGIAVAFEVEGEFPTFGNNDDRVDLMAAKLSENFMNKLRSQKLYRDAVPTQSLLTITSNVVYGNKTGDTPCGRKKGEPFPPGANPCSGRDTKGFIAAGASLAKLPYEHSQDGISWTANLTQQALGKLPQEQVDNLSNCLDGFCSAGGYHINVNVLDRDMLIDAMENPGKYPELTIRVSGYAVNFTRLTREQQLDVINRTFHKTA